MKLSIAQEIANNIKKDLYPYCQKVEIGGSVRREKENVKDIEIICVPNRNTFNNKLTTEYCLAVYKIGKVIKGLKTNSMQNAKHLKINQGEIMVDLFIVDNENFGLQYLIRTGPALYSAKILKEFNQLGYTSEGGYPIKKREKAIHRQGLFATAAATAEKGTRLEFRTEQEVYDFIGLPFVEPQNRK